MTKRAGYGSVLTCTTSTGTLEVAYVRSISGPEVSGEDVDTTTLDSSSRYRTFVPGHMDPGEVTLDLVYSSTITSHKRIAYFMGQGTAKTWTVYHGSSTGPSRAFSAYIKGMSAVVPMDDVISCEVTMKVSGKPGFTT